MTDKEKLYNVTDWSWSWTVDPVKGISAYSGHENFNKPYRIVQKNIDCMPGYGTKNSMRFNRYTTISSEAVDTNATCLIQNIETGELIFINERYLKPIKVFKSIEDKRKAIIDFMAWKNETLISIHKKPSLSLFNYSELLDFKDIPDFEVNQIYQHFNSLLLKTIYWSDYNICPYCVINKVNTESFENCALCEFGARYAQCFNKKSLYTQILKELEKIFTSKGITNALMSNGLEEKIMDLFKED